jgi:outer membrane protein assembly factor BamA
LEQQFVGGEWQFTNNVEARKPIFADSFNRQLSAALFFDVGRAYRKLSDFGDFGYGVGGGLRYVVRAGPLSGVARADYGVSFDQEGDDSTTRLHLTFGLPF